MSHDEKFILADGDHCGSARRLGGRQGHIRPGQVRPQSAEWAAFSEFKGYEGWQIISISHNGELLAVILGNPAMIDAYKAGAPGNGKPFPDGAKMAKIHWNA